MVTKAKVKQKVLVIMKQIPKVIVIIKHIPKLIVIMKPKVIVTVIIIKQKVTVILTLKQKVIVKSKVIVTVIVIMKQKQYWNHAVVKINSSLCGTVQIHCGPLIYTCNNKDRGLCYPEAWSDDSQHYTNNNTHGTKRHPVNLICHSNIGIGHSDNADAVLTLQLMALITTTIIMDVRQQLSVPLPFTS